MLYILKKLCFCLLIVLSAVNSLRAQKSYDVVIYGGTTAGLAAAIQVAKMGKTVALVEPSKHIGGNLVEGLGSTDIDNHKEFQNSLAIGGLALEFYKRVAKIYGRSEAFEKMLANRERDMLLWKTESSVAEKVIMNWLAAYKIDIILSVSLEESKGNVAKQGKAIKSITLENGSTLLAKVFIDATLEGDLLAAAGVTTVVGREANSLYGETLNGIREKTTHAQFVVKVNPYVVPENPASGLIQTIQQEPLGEPGTADKNIQAYCFRVCLTQKEYNKIAFSKPVGYDREQYEIYIRYLKAGGKLYVPRANLPNGKTDLGAWHDLSHNLYGMNKAYPEANKAGRKKILEQHAVFTKGLFYFLSTDTAIARIAPSLQKEWASWGYAKDEFVDNNNFPRNFYVRDARRMVSDYVVTEKMGAKENAIAVEDPIAIAYWPMDVHSVRRIVRNGYAYNEGFVFAGGYWKAFGISQRALVPKASECTNMLTPTSPSASHIAFGAMRLEHNFMDLGQVCGTMAVIALNNAVSVQRISYQELKKQLLADGLFIDASKLPLPLEK